MQRWRKWQVNELAAKQQNKQLPDDLSEDRCCQKTGVVRRQVLSEDRCCQKTGVLRRQVFSEAPSLILLLNMLMPKPWCPRRQNVATCSITMEYILWKLSLACGPQKFCEGNAEHDKGEQEKEEEEEEEETRTLLLWLTTECLCPPRREHWHFFPSGYPWCDHLGCPNAECSSSSSVPLIQQAAGQ